MPWLFLIAELVFIVIMCFGLTHIAYISAIRKERIKKHNGPTSNQRNPFSARINEVNRKFLSTEIIGELRGAAPYRGNVVYVDNHGSHDPVFITDFKTLDMPDEGINSVPVKIRVFGAKRLDLIGGILTNRRTEEQRTDLDRPDLEITYPVVLRRTAKERTVALFITIMGLFVLAMTVYAVMSGMPNSAGAWIGFLASLFLVIIGLYIMLDTLTFELRIDEGDQITVKGLSGRHVHHISNVKSTVHMQQNSDDVWVMELRDPAGKNICAVDSRSGRFDEAVLVFKNYAKKKQYSAVKNVFSGDLYVPVEFISDGGEPRPRPVIMVNKEGDRAVFVFDSVDRLQKQLSDRKHVVIKTDIGGVVKATDNFAEADTILLFKGEDPSINEAHRMTKYVWEQIQKYLGEQN